MHVGAYGGTGTFGGDGAFGDAGIPSYLNNRGNFEAEPILRIYGACTDPAVINLTTGEVVAMTGEIDAGDWVDFNMHTGTITAADGSDRFDLLSPESSLFHIEPGINEITFGASTFDDNSRLVVSWRDAYL